MPERREEIKGKMNRVRKQKRVSLLREETMVGRVNLIVQLLPRETRPLRNQFQPVLPLHPQREPSDPDYVSTICHKGCAWDRAWGAHVHQIDHFFALHHKYDREINFFSRVAN